MSMLARRCRHQAATASWICQVTLGHLVSDGPLLHIEERLEAVAEHEHPGLWSGPTPTICSPQQPSLYPGTGLNRCHASGKIDHQEHSHSNAESPAHVQQC